MAKANVTERLEGREITDATTLRALYQLGDFKYQAFGARNWVSKIKTCNSPSALMMLETIVDEGGKVVVEEPKKK